MQLLYADFIDVLRYLIKGPPNGHFPHFVVKFCQLLLEDRALLNGFLRIAFQHTANNAPESLHGPFVEVEAGEDICKSVVHTLGADIRAAARMVAFVVVVVLHTRLGFLVLGVGRERAPVCRAVEVAGQRQLRLLLRVHVLPRSPGKYVLHPQEVRVRNSWLYLPVNQFARGGLVPNLPCIEGVGEDLVEALLGQRQAQRLQASYDIHARHAVQLPAERLGNQFSIRVEATVSVSALPFLIITARDFQHPSTCLQALLLAADELVRSVLVVQLGKAEGTLRHHHTLLGTGVKSIFGGNDHYSKVAEVLEHFDSLPSTSGESVEL